MVFDYLYKENSAGDLGILYQLKARLNRKDVHAEVNKSYHGSESEEGRKMKTGLLLNDFQAFEEGDGSRLEHLWKFMMLLFKVTGKTSISCPVKCYSITKGSTFSVV